MQIQINDLITGRFKKAVNVKFPTEKLNENGDTIYDNATFIGEFVNINEATKENFNREINALRAEASELNDNDYPTELDKQKRRDGISREIESLSINYMQTYFVGFEKHPKHPFPFLVGDKELEPNSDNIKMLLSIQRVREAISDTYFDEVNAFTNEKLNKVLAGNSRK